MNIRNTAENLHTRINKREDGCWEWALGIPKSGYAQIHWYGRTANVYQILYSLKFGKPSKRLLRRCQTRACINPDHWYVHVSEENVRTRFFSRVKKGPLCWEWQGEIGYRGYGRTHWDGRSWSAHRLSYHLHKGEIPKGLFVCHTCDNRKCVNPEHLWLGTNDDNMKDAAQKKRMPYGERNRGAKLTEVQALEILNSPGLGWKELSKKYGVGRNAIIFLLKGKTWKHLQRKSNGTN